MYTLLRNEIYIRDVEKVVKTSNVNNTKRETRKKWAFEHTDDTFREKTKQAKCNRKSVWI